MTFLILVAALVVAAKYGWPLGIGAAVLGWLIHSFIFPWKTCLACGGNPKTADQSGNNFRISCWRCESSGRQRRLGSRIIRGGWGKL